jgi:hypothetical protein
MVIGFPKPTFSFDYDPQVEIQALEYYRDTKPGRAIPAKSPDRLLVATWNIANLGIQERRPEDYRVLAAVIRWFDLVSLQEVHDDLSGLNAIRAFLPSYKVVFSDKAGNDERAAYLYDSTKVELLEKIGEISIPPSALRYIKLPGITEKFAGFDRNPYLVSFKAGHLYFGEDTDLDRDRRSLEAYAVSRWADLRRKSRNAYLDKIIVLGDFNLPKVEPGDPIYDALRKRGLRRPKHSTKIASNITSDKDYDQIMFFPGQVKEEFTKNIGIYDYDGAIFNQLWQKLVNDHGETMALIRFRTYLRYFISDHRPLWAEFKID